MTEYISSSDSLPFPYISQQFSTSLSPSSTTTRDDIEIVLPTKYEIKVLYPYDAQLHDELTIRPGDVITVKEGDNDEDSLWWMGTNENRDKGYFFWKFTETKASSHRGILSLSSSSLEMGITGPHCVSFKEISYFVEDRPGDELECIICKNLADDPHQSKCCGHTMCYDCAHKWGERKDSCPQCRVSPLEVAVDTRIKRHISSLNVYCTHYKSGCEWKGSFNTVRDHLSENCPYEDVECRNDGCTERLQRRYLTKHMDEECSMRIVECPCCKDDDLPYHELVNAHYKECPDWPMRCPNHCSTEVKLTSSTLQGHLEDNCPEQVISCQFAEAGCPVKVQRKEMADHVQQSMGEHMTAMMNDHMRLKKDHTELQADHRDLKENLDVLKEDHHSLMIDHGALKKDHGALKKDHSALADHYDTLIINYQKLKKDHEKLKKDHEKPKKEPVKSKKDQEKTKKESNFQVVSHFQGVPHVFTESDGHVRSESKAYKGYF